MRTQAARRNPCRHVRMIPKKATHTGWIFSRKSKMTNWQVSLSNSCCTHLTRRFFGRFILIRIPAIRDSEILSWFFTLKDFQHCRQSRNDFNSFVNMKPGLITNKDFHSDTGCYTIPMWLRQSVSMKGQQCCFSYFPWSEIMIAGTLGTLGTRHGKSNHFFVTFKTNLSPCLQSPLLYYSVSKRPIL